MAINEYVYKFLEDVIHLSWLVTICDLVVSGTLYVGIYVFMFFLYKCVVIKIKKEILGLKGKWYHVHVKKNDAGIIKTGYLRAGETIISQDLYELKFKAENFSYSLNETGEIEKDDDESTKTEWSSWSVDWDGKEKIVTCFKASTPEKIGDEFTHRHGIHRLTVSADRKMMSGEFADEYPSSNRGTIYFFRSEEKMLAFIKKFFEKNKK